MKEKQRRRKSWTGESKVPGTPVAAAGIIDAPVDVVGGAVG